MNPEDRDAKLLRKHLDGEDVVLEPDDLEVVGLFRQASGAEAPDPWAKIAESQPAVSAPTGPEPVALPSGPSGLRWAMGAFALAAGVMLAVVFWPGDPAPLPPGANAAELSKAQAALDPTTGPPLARLGALHAAAGKERNRLVAELSR